MTQLEDNAISEKLRDIIRSDSKLGSQLISLLLVSNKNSKEIIDAINLHSVPRSMASSAAEKLLLGNGSSGNSSSSNSGSSKEDEDDYEDDEDDDEKANQRVRDGDLDDDDADYEDLYNGGGNIQEDELVAKMEKRRKNLEASARFRVRRKQRELENKIKLQSLKTKVKELQNKINELELENQHWKDRLEKINEMKANALLDDIKKQNTETSRI